MELKEMKELYNNREWILVKFNNNGHECEWILQDSFNMDLNGVRLKLIHKKHEDILKAYLEDNNISILWKYKSRDSWSVFNDGFIETYDENLEYKLKVTQEEINQVIDKQLAEENGTIKLNGGGTFIKEFASKHFEENKTYEITIKEVISIN